MKKDPVGIRPTRSCSSEAKSNGDDGGGDSFHAQSIGQNSSGRKYAAEGGSDKRLNVVRQ